MKDELYKHAKKELKEAGYLEGSSLNRMLANDVLELIEVFSNQGHSNNSVVHCLYLFNTLARFKKLEHEEIGE